MIDRYLRDIVNLLLYGGAFIGLCAACITAFTFELIGNVEDNLDYIMLVGIATAALYGAHRVIGLHKLAHVTTNDRYSVIRKYKYHIWIYSALWVVLSFWFFIPHASWDFILWLIPGGSIAITYVVPLFSGGRRLRDIGWIKIIMIGWSWAWLTAFLPAYYFSDQPLHLSILMGIARMFFIIAITIPFEIRDMSIDQSVGLQNMPLRFGLKRSIRWGWFMCIMNVLIAGFLSMHYINGSYVLTMICICILTVWILQKSATTKDDYFFSGITDGTMILTIVAYHTIQSLT